MAPAPVALGTFSDGSLPGAAHGTRPRRSGGCGGAISAVETGQLRWAGTPWSFKYFASASRVACSIAVRSPDQAAVSSGFSPSLVHPGSGAPKIRRKRSGHSLPACELGMLHSKHISGGLMCEYGEYEPRIAVEYGIHTSLRLSAACD